MIKRYKVVFAGLDNTLIESISGDITPHGVWDMKLRLPVLMKIKEMRPDYLLIVSNQDEIQRGLIDRNSFGVKMEYIACCIREFLCGNTRVEYRYCASNDSQDIYRMPNTGMLQELSAMYIPYELTKKDFLMVGSASGRSSRNSARDRKTAENFNIDYMDVYDLLIKKVKS